jgi:hypothetical protein
MLTLGCRGEPRALLVISGPTGLRSFQIAEEEGEVLWAIAASEPATLSRIEYGSIPEGFYQLIPEDNAPPRLLIAGEWLESETVSIEGTFYHEGVATGPDTFQPVANKMVLKPSRARN